MIKVYVDGCRKKSGAGGYSWMAQMENNIIYGGGYSTDTTNNIMELAGPLSALEELDVNRYTIYSDSRYFVDGFNSWMAKWKRNGWRRGTFGEVKNLDMWKRLHFLKSIHDVRACWVRGHNGHTENELCDAIANHCCTHKVKFKTEFERLITKDEIPFIAKGTKEESKFGDVKKNNINETFIRMDINGRIYIKDGRTLEQYLNHPEQLTKRKKLCGDVPKEMCIVTKDFFDRMTSTYDTSRES